MSIRAFEPDAVRCWTRCVAGPFLFQEALSGRFRRTPGDTTQDGAASDCEPAICIRLPRAVEGDGLVPPFHRGPLPLPFANPDPEIRRPAPVILRARVHTRL